jgi:hypothetical protein
MSVEAKFKSHLYKICKDDTLREFALDFFHDLSSRYEGREFTRDEFASLVIDGKVVEQDVVIALFKNKDKVRAEEVFTYLFTKNIDSFAIKRRVPDVPDAAGGVDALNKTCTIAKYNYRSPRTHSYSSRPSIKERIEEYRRNKALKKSITRDHYKRTIYHELSHVFELETYNDRNIIRNEMSDKTFMKAKKGYVMFYGDDIAKGLLEAIAMGENYGLTAQNFITILRAQGATAVSEILNEEHSLDILGNKQILNIFTADECNQRYVRKSRLAGTCGYNPNYDIATLVDIVLGEKNIRFNSCSALYQLGNLNVSKEVLEEAKSKLISNMEKDLITEEDKSRNKDIELLLEDLDSYDTLALIMGVAGGYGYGMESPNGVTLEDYKVIVQGLLIEGIKNDIVQQLNDPMVYKGKEFYEKINTTLETIDSFICYPNTSTDFAYTRMEGEVKYQDVLDIRTHVPARYATKNPNMRNIVAFSELIEAVRVKLDGEDGNIEGIEEIMTFYRKQQEIEKNYEKYESEARFIEELHKEDLERREEFRQRKSNVDYGTRGV